MSAYTIKIEAFEGPFDLLFHLIEKNKFDIYDIPISLIADQYLDYIAEMHEMDLEVASEFLVMVSTLLHIKSRLLLPAPSCDEAEDGADPKEQLIANMLEYKRYKEFSASLRGKAAYWGEAHYRLAGYDAYDAEHSSLRKNVEQLSLFDMDRGRLISIYRGLLESRKKRHDNVDVTVKRIVERDRVTMAKKVRQILGYLLLKPRFLFQKLFNPKISTKMDIIMGFTALLELTQQNRVALRQKRQFGGLLVSRKERKAT
jgi:segregation and condensation protein A